MFLATKLNDNQYSVTDTSDMVTETMDVETIKFLLERGYSIYGVSLFSIEYNINLTVLLRMKNSNEELIDFNGHCTEAASGNWNEYTHQIIDFGSELDDLINLETFRLVIKWLNAVNKINKEFVNICKDLPSNYIIISRSPKVFTIQYTPTSEVYDCDFFSCLGIYLFENSSIYGVDEITTEYVSSKGEYLVYEECLVDYWRHSLDMRPNNQLHNESNCLVDSLHASYNDNRSLVIMDETYIPLFNLRDSRRVMNCNCLENLAFTRGTVTNVDKDGITFEDGNYTNDWTWITRNFNILILSEELKNQLYNIIQAKTAKQVIMQKYEHYSEWLKGSTDLSHSSYCHIKMPELRINSYRDYCDVSARTQFGCITVKSVTSCLDDIEDIIENMWLIRVTHTGSCWYNFVNHKVEYGTSNSCTMALFNNKFHKVLNKAKEFGITYYYDTILPMCCVGITVDENTIDISIACLTKDYNKGSEDWGDTAYNVINLPLICLGGKFYEYKNCYAYHCAFQTIYLSKDIVNYLYSDINYSDIIEPWSDKYFTNNKKGKTLFNHCERSMVQTLKEVYENVQ